MLIPINTEVDIRDPSPYGVLDPLPMDLGGYSLYPVSDYVVDFFGFVTHWPKAR